MNTYEVISTSILIATLVAIVAGPVAAVLITRWGDDKRESRRRKAEILSTLMRTRPIRLSLEHVGALNLIQMEFHGINPVQFAYSNYMAHLNQEMPTDAKSVEKFIEERHDRFVELLHQIGQHLGYGFDKRDLQKLSYGPIGWENDENTIRMIRTMAMDVMAGKQSLSVVMSPKPASSEIFPPPPTK